MPAKKASRKLVHKQSLLGVFQKNKKVLSGMEQKIEVQNQTIKDLKVISSANSTTIDQLNKSIDNERNKLSYKRKKLHARNVLDSKSLEVENSCTISSVKVKKRLANPTSSDTNQKAKVLRVKRK